MALIDTDDFLDLFYVASAGQDKTFVKVVEAVVDDTPTIDPVHAAGGCYCHECENLDTTSVADWCLEHQRVVSPLGFCGYGRRRDGGER